MSVVILRRALCSLRVTFLVVVRSSRQYKTPLLLSYIRASWLDLGRPYVLLHIVGSSTLVVVSLFLAFAVPRVVPLLATVVAGRCFHCHDDATTSDRLL